MKAAHFVTGMIVSVLVVVMMSPLVVQAGEAKQFWLPAPENPTPERIRNDVRAWLTFSDFFDMAKLVHPVQYGERAYPAIREVLEDLDRFEKSLDDPARARFAISRALELVAAIGVPNAELAMMTKSYLTSVNAGTRGQALNTLATIGDRSDLPILLAMLYDLDSGVRHATVSALSSTGDESVLVALDIWQKQATEADNARPLTEKWIGPAMLKRLEEARQAIRDRVNKPEPSDKPDESGK